MNKAYPFAYVTRRNVHPVDAVRPETVVGPDMVPVSQHPDYRAWDRERQHTVHLAKQGPSYQTYAARAVCEALGWWSGAVPQVGEHPEPIKRLPPLKTISRMRMRRLVETDSTSRRKTWN